MLQTTAVKFDITLKLSLFWENTMLLLPYDMNIIIITMLVQNI